MLAQGEAAQIEPLIAAGIIITSSLEVLPDTEVHLPFGLVARFVERNAEIDAYRSDGRVVAERRAGGKIEISDRYIVSVS